MGFRTNHEGMHIDSRKVCIIGHCLHCNPLPLLADLSTFYRLKRSRTQNISNSKDHTFKKSLTQNNSNSKDHALKKAIAKANMAGEKTDHMFSNREIGHICN